MRLLAKKLLVMVILVVKIFIFIQVSISTYRTVGRFSHDGTFANA